MKRMRLFVVAAGLAVSLAAFAWAAATKDYQVTGPILELTDTKIVVQKGEEKWEVGKDADTKVTGTMKVGAKVTIKYKMTATSVEVK